MDSLPIESNVYLSFGPQFRGSLAEGANNVYRLKSQPDSKDESQFQFNLRSPGNQLMLSSKIYCEMEWEVGVQGSWSEATVGAPCIRTTATTANTGATRIVTSGQKLALPEGYAFSDALQSCSITINNQTMTTSGQDAWHRAISKVFIPSSTAQRVYGAGYDQYDNVGTSSVAHQPTGGNSQVLAVHGLSMDSGLVAREQALFQAGDSYPLANMSAGFQASVADAAYMGANQLMTDATSSFRKVRLRVPIFAGCISPLGLEDQSDYSPFRGMCLAIPNVDSLSIQLLFSKLKECLFRSFGFSTRVGNRGIVAAQSRSAGKGVVAILNESSVALYTKWTRLAGWRAFPPQFSAKVPTFKITYAPRLKAEVNNKVQIAGNGLLGKNGLYALLPQSADGNVTVLNTGDLAGFGSIPSRSVAAGGRSIRVDYTSQSYPQPPKWICLMNCKDVESYTHDDGVKNAHAGGLNFPIAIAAAGTANDEHDVDAVRYKARLRAVNSGSSACILRAEIEVLSSPGTIKFSNDAKYPYKLDRARIWEHMQDYACDTYFQGRKDLFEKHDSCLVVPDSIYMGSLASSGVNFPITVSVRQEIENRRVFMSASNSQCIHELASAEARGFEPCCDVISPKSCMVAIFTKHFLTITTGTAQLDNVAINQSNAQVAYQRQGAV